MKGQSYAEVLNDSNFLILVNYERSELCGCVNGSNFLTLARYERSELCGCVNGYDFLTLVKYERSWLCGCINRSDFFNPCEPWKVRPTRGRVSRSDFLTLAK